MADGLGFVQRADEAYNRLLLKEVVHHFEQGELPALFAGAFRQLRPGGRVVIMTRCEPHFPYRPDRIASTSPKRHASFHTHTHHYRPHDPSQFPFFAGAIAAWSAAQLPESVYQSALEASGFRVAVDHADYPVSIPASQWLGMVRGRFWSNFDGFSDTEMEAGVEEIRGRLGLGLGEDRTITFPDRIVFITGTKPSVLEPSRVE